MTKQGIITLLAAVSALAVLAAGATLAYFTDSEQASNIVTIGHVDIRLTENEVRLNKGGNGRYWEQLEGEENIKEEGILFEGVLPGDTIPKNPTITVESGSNDAYIRVKVEAVADGQAPIEEGELKKLLKELHQTIDAQPDWTGAGADGEYTYFYYKGRMAAGDAAVVFEKVKIPGEWGNATAGKTFSIRIRAEAIQAENTVENGVVLTDESGNVTGWELGSAGIEDYHP